MTVREFSEKLSFDVVVSTSGMDRNVEKVYCCDLLSFVMGCAPSDCAWVTVMGNVNAIAVALLADMSCIILAEKAVLDDDARQKAEQNDVTVLRSPNPIFETAHAVHQLLTEAIS